MPHFKRLDVIIYGIILMFVVVGLWALIRNPFYTSHDGFTHTARIAAYYQILETGQFPPRWAANFYNGLGSPIFVYSYQLPYFLGSVFHSFGVTYQTSFRLVMGLAFLLSALTAFWWLKNKFGAWAGLVGAVFYLWVPYRFLNLYVRGALAESLAWSLAPLVLLAIERKRWYLLVFSLTAVLLSHNEVAALTLPVFLGWALISKSLKTMLTATVAAFFLSSFIYLPDFFERNYIHFDRAISYFQDHFVAFWQLLRSPWGYGFDFPGTARDEMSFQLGLAQILAVGLVIIIGRRKIFQKGVLFFLGLLAVSIFLMVDEPLVRPVWKALPIIKTIVDFPWRFLGVTTLCFSFLAAYLVSLTKNSKILIVFLLVAVVIFNRNHLRINLPQSFPDETFDRYQGSATATSDEYRPIWSATNKEITTAPGKIPRYYFPETEIKVEGKILAKDKDWVVVNDGTIQLKDKYLDKPYEVTLKETPLRQGANLLSFVSVVAIMALWLKTKASGSFWG